MRSGFVIRKTGKGKSEKFHWELIDGQGQALTRSAGDFDSAVEASDDAKTFVTAIEVGEDEPFLEEDAG